MTAIEITEGNKLIAEFMSVKIGEDIYSWKIGCLEPLKEEHLAYDKSWGWLIPVLEKICRTRVGDGREYIEYAYPITFGMIDKETGGIMVRLNGHQLHIADTLIEATWFAVIEFIEGYNKDVNRTSKSN